MLKIIREILLKIVNDIDTGNSNLSPEECEEVITRYAAEMRHFLFIYNKLDKNLFIY